MDSKKTFLNDQAHNADMPWEIEFKGLEINRVSKIKKKGSTVTNRVKSTRTRD